MQVSSQLRLHIVLFVWALFLLVARSFFFYQPFAGALNSKEYYSLVPFFLFFVWVLIISDALKFDSYLKRVRC